MLNLFKFCESIHHVFFSYASLVCWSQDPHERPAFSKIIETLEDIAASTFMGTEHESFRTMQKDWQTEIDQNFAELKEREKV